jgi:sulfur-oxidizing protein SoxY
MTAAGARRQWMRRRLLQGTGLFAFAPWLGVLAQPRELPAVAALTAFLAGRTPRWERLRLDLPALADNGLVVPMKIVVDGPFAPGAHVSAIHVFSEINPVPEMAVFEFPVPLERIELESRVRLAGTQRVAVVATMTDGVLLAAVADVVVTLAGCMDGT